MAQAAVSALDALRPHATLRRRILLLRCLIGIVTFGWCMLLPEIVPLKRGGTIVFGDPMALTGYVAATVGLWAATFIEARFRAALALLSDTAVLGLDETRLVFLVDDLERKAWWPRLLLGGGIGLMTAGFHLYFYYRHQSDYHPNWLLYTITATLLAAVGGERLALVAVYGGVARQLRRTGASLSLIPGHADGLGGLGPVGRYLTFALGLFQLLIGWLAVWLLLVTVDVPPGTYHNYKDWILLLWVLIGVATLAAISAVLLPTLGFGALQRSAKAELAGRLLSSWDPSVVGLHDRRNRAASTSEFVAADVAIDEAVTKLDAIHRIPDWPLAPWARRFLTLTTWSPLISLVVQGVLAGTLKVESVIEKLMP